MAATGVAELAEGAVAVMPAPTESMTGDGSTCSLWELPWQRPESRQVRRLKSRSCRLPQNP